MISLFSLPPYLITAYLLSILIALSVHEWAHAMVATRLGDPTPHNHGRLTLNPAAHLDPIGAVLFLMAGVGWAKPVPVNPAYFLKPKRDVLLTAAAGPFSNLILAAISFISLILLLGPQVLAYDSIVYFMTMQGASGSVAFLFMQALAVSSLTVNLGLMAFNLLPIAPLDGSKVLQAFIPLRYEDVYEEYMRRGLYILIALFIAERILNVHLLSTWIITITDTVLDGMRAIALMFVAGT